VSDASETLLTAGKRVVRRLLEARVPVTVLDKVFFEDEIAEITSEYPAADLRVVIGDIRDPTQLENAVAGVKGVIHLAAVSRVLWCLENQADCTDVNVRGTKLVLEALKTGWFIQASSREVSSPAR
jgi:nucleoside-diphosphate-sugar epimerase